MFGFRTSAPTAAGALAIVVAAALCSACSSSGGASASGKSSASVSGAPSVAKDPALAAQLPAAIKRAGVITVGSDETYPPFESISNGAVVGLDPELAGAIGQVLGVHVKFVNTAFDALIPALTAKKVDMAMSSIGDTKQRERVIDFATYYQNGTLVLVKKGNPQHIVSTMACGEHIGVIRGSLQQVTFLPAQAPKCKRAGKPAPVAAVYQNGPQAQLALQSGRLSGVMEDAPVVLNVAGKQPALFDSAGPFARNPDPGGVAFPKGSPLVAAVHGAINHLIKDGVYARILKHWNLSKIAIAQSQINGAHS